MGDRIAYLEKNRTAYLEVISQPILKDGEQTLEKYFSLSDEIGGGKLKQRIRDMLLGPNVNKPTVSDDLSTLPTDSIDSKQTSPRTAPGSKPVIHFTIFRKGGSTSFWSFLPRKRTKRFSYRNPNIPEAGVDIYLNECGWGAADIRHNPGAMWLMRDPVTRAWSEWNYRKSKAEPNSFAKARRQDTWQTYVTRHANHHVKHVGPGATNCLCGEKQCKGKADRSQGINRYNCIMTQSTDQLQQNLQAALDGIKKAAVVGTLENIDVTMVLLWHSKLLNFYDEPCSLQHSNSRKKPPLSPDKQSFIENVNPYDVLLYEAIGVEFERRVREASKDPIVAEYIQRAKSPQ